MATPATTHLGLEWLLKSLPYDAALRGRFANDPPDLRRRARLVAAFGVLACTGGWSLAFSHYFLFDIPLPRVVAPFLAGTLALVAPLLLLLTRSLRACAHLVAGCWLVAVGWGMWLRGGLASPPLMSQIAVPFIALAILDRRAGVLWSLVVLAEVLAYAALLAAGVHLPDLMPEAHRLTSNVVAASLFGTLMLAMGMAMEWLRLEAEQELEVAVDRKARAEREAGMLRADRLAAVGQLVASLAHEINNPLSYLMGNLAYLERELPQEDHRGAVMDALDGARRVKTIVQDLRTFAREDDEHLVPLDLLDVVNASLRMVAGEARHRATVATEFSPCPRILGTPTRVGQVAINLLVNAVQASASDGRPNVITVSLDTTATGDARLRVRDTGVGIPADVLGRVTEPFFTTKPVGEGSGLGLSICSTLITRLGGTLDIQSTSGEGTCVTVTLPPAPPGDASVPVTPSAEVAPTAALRILAIDDEAAVLRALERALPHHQVVCAQGGRAALQILATDKAFDLVLCDVMMPDLNGADVADALRRDAPDLEPRLVLITAGATTERARAFLSANRYPVLPKPLDLAELTRVVAAAQPRRGMR
jgi:signal transduction histidine kinase/ActR/RegA family two-component response regulator